MTGQALIIALLALSTAACAADPRPVQVKVVTGGHNHEASFYAIFEGDPRLAVDVDPHPGAYEYDLIPGVDVLVLYDTVDAVSKQKMERIRSFVDAGRGLVVIHHALADFSDWAWWGDEVVGGRWFTRATGEQPKSGWKHDVPLTVVPVRDHPVTSGIDALHLVDETYKNVWISPKVTILMKTDEPTADGPMVWIGPHPKARVVYIQPGHGRSTHLDPGFQRLVRQAILWAAHR